MKKAALIPSALPAGLIRTLALSLSLMGALALTPGTSACAQSSSEVFEIETPDPPRPKTQTLRLSILDQGISDISRSLMLRLSYRKLFATDESHQNGYVFSGHFNHLANTHPALLNRFVQAEDAGFYPNFNELGVGLGYRFAFENFAIIPQAYARDMIALGNNVSQHLIGFEPGLRLEYWIYPEVARLSVDYGLNVPVLHLANTTGNISPFGLSLNRVYTELSYRVLENLDLVTGFYWWQVPAQLGTGGITDTTLSNMTGFQIGGGLTF